MLKGIGQLRSAETADVGTPSMPSPNLIFATYVRPGGDDCGGPVY
jgi:hypothetical protein